MDDKLNPVTANFFSTINVCSSSVNKSTLEYTSTFIDIFIFIFIFIFSTFNKIAKFICAVVKNG
jgi:hypothetical protein